MATSKKLTDDTGTAVKPQDQAAASEPSTDKKQDQATDKATDTGKGDDKGDDKAEKKVEKSEPESTGGEAEQKDKVDTVQPTIGDAVPQDKAGEVSELEKAQDSKPLDTPSEKDLKKNVGTGRSSKQPGKRGAGLHHR